MSRDDDVTLLKKLPKEKLPDYVLMQLRNLWTVDGLYYLGIEERNGTKTATEVDAQVWAVMGKIEARKLKQFLGITTTDIPSMMHALQYTSWALDLEDKHIEVAQDRAILRNIRCRVQNTRKSKGLSEFGCKPVRYGFLAAFAKEFNPEIVVKCIVCPPDSHPEDLWCEWEFTYKEK
ncbi:MAG: hypothetical protein BV459_08655 [Thermoplasmata archaeon M11B2D]|nr:MAG: hypothetical protein BV459_08655 [Thermoplasmata archaeon M11B2D]PNX50295.1 MAG: hypothetical protein BV458_13495 [Thermoplasmata archaeon M9B2D]